MEGAGEGKACKKGVERFIISAGGRTEDHKFPACSTPEAVQTRVCRDGVGRGHVGPIAKTRENVPNAVV